MNHSITKLTILAITASTLLTGCATTNQTNSSATSQPTTTKVAKSQSLADLNYKSGNSAYVIVNDNRATLNPKSYTKVHVDYTNLDHLNRTNQGNTANLDSRNVANDSLRTTQTVQPTGWHQKFVKNEAIINRGHLIAYSLSKGIGQNGQYNPSAQSGDQNNPKNLFTQTAFSNQEVQTIFETKVRNALKAGKKVIYQVKPIFKGNNLMASGVQMQAISTDKSLDFNVYLFNVQPGIKFDYATGRSTIDPLMKVPTPAGAPHFNDAHQTAYEGQHRNSMPYHHHHWIRDYLIYRGIKHVINKHYEHKYGYGEEEHHSFFGHHMHLRW